MLKWQNTIPDYRHDPRQAECPTLLAIRMKQAFEAAKAKKRQTGKVE